MALQQFPAAQPGPGQSACPCKIPTTRGDSGAPTGQRGIWEDRRSRRNPPWSRLAPPGDHGGPDAKAKDSPTLRWNALPGHGTWHPVLYLLTPPQPHLIDIYYLSHAFPRQTNHQQRKPTTTTMTAMETPTIVPVERLLLFALEDAHVFAWLSRV